MSGQCGLNTNCEINYKNMEPIFHPGITSDTNTNAEPARRKKPQMKVKISKNVNNKYFLSLKRNIFEKYRDINPFYVSNSSKQVYEFVQSNTSPQEIKIIIPNMYLNNELYTISYNSIKYYKKTYLEWFLELKEREFDMTQQIYGIQFIVNINNVYADNQKYRWAFKRLFLAWVKKKCLQKEIGYNEDVISYNILKDGDRVSFYCLKSRCLYNFSATTLLNSICSNLETQVYSLATIVYPKNPLTNMALGYGQLLHIYNECLSWCARKHKPIPTAFCMFRNADFKISALAKIHNTYLQHRASHNYMKNDDVLYESFIEQLDDLMKTQKTFIVLSGINVRYVRIHNFSRWLKRDPNNHILKQWRRYITDYTFYKETGILIRENWLSLMNVIHDFKVLFQASIPYFQ